MTKLSTKLQLSAAVLLLIVSAAGSAYDYGYQKRSAETKRLIESSLRVKRKYERHQIVAPVQMVAPETAILREA